MRIDKAKRIKRVSDVIMSFFLLIVLSPVIITVLLISIYEIRDFPIFIQKRGLSIDGKLFNIYKIRTVKNETGITEKTGRKFLLSPGYKEKVPKFCKILRRYGIDELPQLINVIKGEMSLIGPRPLDLFDLKCLKENYPIENKKRRQLNSKVGILGMWQLYGNKTLGAKDLLYWDRLYEENFLLQLDIKIIVQSLSIYFGVRTKEDSIFTEEIVIQN